MAKVIAISKTPNPIFFLTLLFNELSEVPQQFDSLVSHPELSGSQQFDFFSFIAIIFINYLVDA